MEIIWNVGRLVLVIVGIHTVAVWLHGQPLSADIDIIIWMGSVIIAFLLRLSQHD